MGIIEGYRTAIPLTAKHPNYIHWWLQKCLAAV